MNREDVCNNEEQNGDVEYWARGALTVLPQPQLQGVSGTVISARFDGLVVGRLT